MFLVNSDTKTDASIILNGQRFIVPKWTALLLQKGADGFLEEVFCSSSISPQSTTSANRDPSLSEATIKISGSVIQWIKEPVGIWDESLSHTFNRPIEQISFTNDATDYLWYQRNNLKVPLESNKKVVVTIRPPTDLVYVYINGKLVHSKEIAVMNVNMDQKGAKYQDLSTEGILRILF